MHTRHDIVGIVKEVGSNVGVFKVGDSVGVGTYVNSCRECENCEEGLEIHCSKGPVFTFGGVDVDGTITKGGYSSFIVVHQRWEPSISFDFVTVAETFLYDKHGQLKSELF